MPIYEYRCDNGHTFEVIQRMTDDPIATCRDCSAPVQRVFHPIAVHFKGSGFYNTDYGKRKRGGDGGSESGDGAKKEAKKESEGSGATKDKGAAKSDSPKSDSPKSDSPRSDSSKSD